MDKPVLVVAGEVSGDLHAADVVRAVKALVPQAAFWGIGGDRLRAEGVELLQHTDRMGVMGVGEVLRQYRFFKDVFRQVLAEVDARRPAAALLVDYPGFNLRLAAELKRRGVKVFYYISPKVWAWNRRRIPRIAAAVDRLLAIFPFEAELFDGTGLRVDYVGNPLVAQIDAFLAAAQAPLPWPPGRRIALLPGSRPQEIARILPALLAAAEKLEARFPDAAFLIAPPNEQIEEAVGRCIAAARQKPSRLGVVRGQAREALRQAEAALVASGTATLEAALVGTPHVLVYKTGALTYGFARAVVKIRHIGLVNIVAGRTVCPELIQRAATPERLAREAARLLDDTPERRAMLAGYADVRRLLGPQDAAQNVAAILARDGLGEGMHATAGVTFGAVAFSCLAIASAFAISTLT